jgi:hypothetical protein
MDVRKGGQLADARAGGWGGRWVYGKALCLDWWLDWTKAATLAGRKERTWVQTWN